MSKSIKNKGGTGRERRRLVVRWTTIFVKLTVSRWEIVDSDDGGSPDGNDQTDDSPWLPFLSTIFNRLETRVCVAVSADDASKCDVQCSVGPANVEEEPRKEKRKIGRK